MALLHPKWLALHVFTIAVCVAMVWLGRWQWRVAIERHGDVRNYAYALQWWAFTGFAILMWWRFVRDSRPEIDARETHPEPPDVPHYVVYQPPVQPPTDDDPERALFNAYLAELNAADQATSAKPTGQREDAE
jgi:hypothetical protein